MQRHFVPTCAAFACAVVITPAMFAPALDAKIAHAHAGDDFFASEVVSYDPGSPEPDLTEPQAALGEPSRWTGEPLFPAVVSPFNPPWTGAEIVSIGPGGHLTLKFDNPIVKEPNRVYGIDLVIFGNIGFADDQWPNGVVGGLLSEPGGVIEVSADGETWHVIPDVDANGLFPTLGYLDVGPYSETPGREESDFTRPVDPALTMDDVFGVDYEALYELYHGSGGGAGIDLSVVGLSEISYVRIANQTSGTVQVDAVASTSPWTPGDLNFNGTIDTFDLLLLIEHWGPATPGGVPADLNGDGVVDVSDLLILLGNWGG